MRITTHIWVVMRNWFLTIITFLSLTNNHHKLSLRACLRGWSARECQKSDFGPIFEAGKALKWRNLRSGKICVHGWWEPTEAQELKKLRAGIVSRVEEYVWINRKGLCRLFNFLKDDGIWAYIMKTLPVSQPPIHQWESGNSNALPHLWCFLVARHCPTIVFFFFWWIHVVEVEEKPGSNQRNCAQCGASLNHWSPWDDHCIQDIEIKKSLFELNSMMNVQWRATLSSNGDFAP